MSTIEEELKQLWEDCPTLNDKEFLAKYSGIENVIGFLHSSVRFHEAISLPFRPYGRAGVKDTRGFVEQMRQGNTEAIKVYETIRNVFGF